MSKLWLTETENMIEDVRQERKALLDDFEKLRIRVDAKSDELGHLMGALETYRRRQEVEAPESNPLLRATNVDDLSYRDIVLAVRDQNDGNIPMTQVTKIFRVKATNPDHAALSAYSTIKRLVNQGKAVKVRPGLYRWVTETDEQRPAPADFQFAEGDRIRIPDDDADVHVAHLGKAGVITKLHGIDTNNERKVERSGQTLPTPCYSV